jgi:hypothetical protein
MVHFLQAPSNALNNFVLCASNKLIEALEGDRLFKTGLEIDIQKGSFAWVLFLTGTIPLCPDAGLYGCLRYKGFFSEGEGTATLATLALRYYGQTT